MPDPRVSIVIPVFNRCDLTVACLTALAEHTPADLYEVVVVDNASTDATPDVLAALEGDVTVVTNETNRGFAVACNQGADRARGDIVLFLNNDTEVRPGWLDALLSALDHDKRIGAAGARLLFPDGTIQHAGMLLVERTDLGGLYEGVHRHVGKPADWPEALEPADMLAVTGAVLAVRAAAFTAVGGFDDGYWNCFEDVDLCLKLGEAGWTVRYVPDAVIVHHESASGAERFTGVQAGVRRFAERWRGRFVPDAVFDGEHARIRR